jgi:hypothetical protein
MFTRYNLFSDLWYVGGIIYNTVSSNNKRDHHDIVIAKSNE